VSKRKSDDEDWATREDVFADWITNGNDIQPDR
jgi:hypothetical protein